VAPAHAAAGDPSESLAQFVRVGAVDLSAAGLARAYASTPGGPASDSQLFDPAVFAALGDQVALLAGNHGKVPLVLDTVSSTGLIGIDQAGISSFTSSPDESTSSAFSGAVDPVTAAFTEAETGGATVNLDAAFDALGVDRLTREILDRIDLSVGTVATQASAQTYSSAQRDYRLGGLALDLRSPLLLELPAVVNAALEEATVLAEAALAEILPGGEIPLPAGTIPDLDVPRIGALEFGEMTLNVSAPDFDNVVRDALAADSVLESDNGVATVDLLTGEIHIDLAPLFGGTLDGLAANTDVFTATHMTAISDAVANALGKTTGLFAAGITEALKATPLGLSIDYDIRVASASSVWPNLSDLVVAHGEFTGSGSLNDFAAGTGTFTSDVTMAAGLPTCTSGTSCSGIWNAGRQTAVVVPAALAVANVALPSAAKAAVAAVVAPVTTALNEVTALVVAEVTPVVTQVYGKITGAFTGLMPALARVVINEQPAIGDLGAESSTVRALGVTMLPELSVSSKTHIGFASSTVVAIADPALAILESIVEPGGPLTVVGDGWNANEDAGAVRLVFTDADDSPIGDPVDAPVDADGVLLAEWTVPAATPVGTLTVTAVQGDLERVATTSVVDPTLTIRGAKPEPGAVLSIEGTGWTPAAPSAVSRAAAAPGEVVLTFTDPKGAVLGESVSAEVQEDGSIRAPWTIPASAPTGTLTVTAVQGEVERTASTVVVIPAAPGTLPATGMDASWTIGIVLGTMLLISGGAFVALRRRNT